MSYSEVHDDDLSAYEEALYQRNKMRNMAESHYVLVAKDQRRYDEVMGDIPDDPDAHNEVVYTATEVKQMLMDVLNVGGVPDRHVHERAGDSF